MATTKSDIEQMNKDFESAYAEPDTTTEKMSDEDAFGLIPEGSEGHEAKEPEAEKTAEGEGTGEDTDSAEEKPATDVAVVVPVSEDEAVEKTAENAMVEAQDKTESGDAREEDSMTPEDAQREKSWRGRLNALEAELKARKAELDEREAKMREHGMDDGSAGDSEEMSASEITESAIETIEDIKSGEMTADEAIQKLKEDFGEDFAKMIVSIIESKSSEVADRVSGEKVSAVSKNVDDLIANIKDSASREHFEMIADAHPDFNDIPGSPMMASYMESLSPEDRAKCEQVVEKGSARQVIKLIDDIKKFDEMDKSGKSEEPNSQAMDDAEGVRSTGMKLPEKPQISDEYESAWDSF